MPIYNSNVSTSIRLLIIKITCLHSSPLYDKIQYKSLSKEMVYVDGIRLEKFIPFFIKEKQLAVV